MLKYAIDQFYVALHSLHKFNKKSNSFNQGIYLLQTPLYRPLTSVRKISEISDINVNNSPSLSQEAT